MPAPFLSSCSSRKPDVDLGPGTLCHSQPATSCPTPGSSQLTSMQEPGALPWEANPHTQSLAPLAELRGELEGPQVPQKH